MRIERSLALYTTLKSNFTSTLGSGQATRAAKGNQSPLFSESNTERGVAADGNEILGFLDQETTILT